MHDYGEHHHHEHTHDHEHDHEHTHEHAPGCADERTELKALLGYMLEHNEHHLGELSDIADRLLELDMHAAAGLVGEAMAEYGKGNRKLEEALAKTEES